MDGRPLSGCRPSRVFGTTIDYCGRSDPQDGQVGYRRLSNVTEATGRKLGKRDWMREEERGAAGGGWIWLGMKEKSVRTQGRVAAAPWENG